MKIINVSKKQLLKTMRLKGVENLSNHNHVLALLEKLENSNSDQERGDHARDLVRYVCTYNVEAVLLESGLRYSRILFKEFIKHNISTYVVEQL